jgi:hypothetical protein
MSCTVDDIKGYISEKQSSMGQDYSLVNFVTSKNYDLVDNKKCHHVNSGMRMLPVSSHLYTPEMCKLAAGKKQDEYNIYNNTKLNENAVEGLNFIVLPGYFNDNMGYFDDPRRQNQIVQRGITRSIASIRAATNNLPIPAHNFSVKWWGYFVPNQTGMWVFETNSDDASYVFVEAAFPASAVVHNGGLHGMRRKQSNNVFLTAGQRYRITMYFGENYGELDMILTVTDPRGQKTRGEKYMYAHDFIPKTAYFALVENSPEDTAKNLFKCMHTPVSNNENTDRMIDQSLKRPSYAKPIHVWSAFPNYDLSARNSGNYLHYNGHILGIYSPTGELRVDLLNGQDGNNQNIQFGNSINGNDLFIGNRNITNVSSPPPGTVNEGLLQEFVKYYNQTPSINLSVIKPGDKLYGNGNGKQLNETIRVTSDGRFVLQFREGQLSIYAFESGCKKTYTDPTTATQYVYTTRNDSTVYSYGVKQGTPVQSDDKLGKTYLANDNEKTLNYISNETKLKYKPYAEYKKTPDVAHNPQVTTDQTHKIPKSDPDGNKKCADTYCGPNNPACNYYYFYEDSADDANNYCVHDTANKTPSYINTGQPGSTINTSDLYIKETKMNLDAYPYLKDIKQVNTVNYSKYANYKVNNEETGDINGALSDTYRKAIDLANYMVHGCPGCSSDQIAAKKGELTGLCKKIESFENIRETKMKKEGFIQRKRTREGFDDHGYTLGAVSDMGAGGNTGTGVAKQIVEQKINPIHQMNQDYAGLVSSLVTGYNTNQDAITKYNTLNSKLISNPIYDYSGNLVNFNGTKTTIEDGIQEDVDLMLYRENALYTVGLMSAAVLVIAAIYIARQ